MRRSRNDVRSGKELSRNASAPPQPRSSSGLHLCCSSLFQPLASHTTRIIAAMNCAVIKKRTKFCIMHPERPHTERSTNKRLPKDEPVLLVGLTRGGDV